MQGVLNSTEHLLRNKYFTGPSSSPSTTPSTLAMMNALVTSQLSSTATSFASLAASVPSSGSLPLMPTADANESNSSSVSEYVPYSERPETYIVPVVFFMIWVVGILGNGTLVVIFLRHRSMRNIPNTYIFSLALADLLVILICVPFVGTIYLFESWLWGSSVCRLTEWAKDVSIGVSVFTLCALSADRYCAVVNPLRKLQTRPITVMVAILIWIFAILCALPAAIMSDTVTYHMVNANKQNNSFTYCTPFGPEKSFTDTYKKYNTVLKAIVYYFFPLLMIAILYALMAKRLHLSAREMPGENAGPQSRSQARARRHVARMVIAFIIVFIICFLPYHVFELWFNLYPNAREEFDDTWHIFRIVGFILSFLNSCLNPVALYCVSGVFRQHFHRYLCCKPITNQHRSGHSAVGGETSFTSTIRRSHNQSIRRKSLSTHSIHNVDKS